MPPLERDGQLLMNTKYALENEPDVLPRAERRWILNRIIDENVHMDLLRALIDKGYNHANSILDIPFSRRDMCKYKSTEDRLHYATNQNSARNIAFEQARREGFRWIFIFDGNGFVSSDTWNAILNAVDIAERRDQRAVMIPMVRWNHPQNTSTLNASSTVDDILSAVPFFSEPQIGFRNDLLDITEVPYDENLKYGVMNKLDLLDRCGYLSTKNLKRTDEKQDVRRSMAHRRSHPWTHATCHCGSFRLSYHSRKERLRPKQVGTDRVVERKRRSEAFSKNLPSANRCGLWIRLWPWPAEDAMRFANDGGIGDAPANEIASNFCREIGTESLTEVIRCRASVRDTSKQLFRRKLHAACGDIRTDRKRRHKQPVADRRG